MTTCREFIEFLDDYAEGRLAFTRRVQFEAHLVTCRACREYLRDYRAAITKLRELCEADPGATLSEVPPGLVSAVREALRRT